MFTSGLYPSSSTSLRSRRLTHFRAARVYMLRTVKLSITLKFPMIENDFDEDLIRNDQFVVLTLRYSDGSLLSSSQFAIILQLLLIVRKVSKTRFNHSCSATRKIILIIKTLNILLAQAFLIS